MIYLKRFLKTSLLAPVYLLVSTLAFTLVLTGTAHSMPLSEGEEFDEIVAIVNNSLITRSELNKEMKTIVDRLRQTGKPLPPISAVESQVLERLITLRLQLDQAEKLGITVTPDMLASTVGNIARKNNLTLPELRATLESEGISFKSFRKNLEREILLSRLQNQEITNKINVSDAEIDNLLKQDKQIGRKNTEYLIQHILIATPEGSTAEQLQTARDKTLNIIQRLRDGADFENIAMLESSGRQALEGGNLGWLKSNQLPSLFVDTVVTMNKGEISKPIRTSSGYHIIRLADIRGDSINFITQTKARHILINTGEMVSDADARTRLEQLHFRIEGGDDFSALARSHSDDKASAIKGGDLGWLGPGSVVKKFQEEMDKLQPGELSKPFRTQFGWHIVQVLERRQHDNSDNILRSEARKIIVDRKSKEATELYLRRLRDEAYVEKRLEEQ